MMQWPDGNQSTVAYESNNTDTVGSTGGITSINNNNNLQQGKRVSSATSTSGGNSSTTEHLQSCLSMLPQSCSFCDVHPLQWGREEVQQWLKWCITEFSFTDVQIEKFAMNGKAMILMKKEDFIERAPSAGDVLFNILQKLLDTQNKSASLTPLSTSVAEQAVMLNLMMAANNPFFAHSLLPGFHNVPFSGGLARSSMAPVSSIANSCSPRESMVSTSSSNQELKMNSSRLLNRSHSQSPAEMKHTHHSTSDGVGFPSHVVRGSEGETRSLPLGSTLSALSMTDSVIKHNLGYSIKKEEQSPAADIIPASPRPKSDCRLLWEFISKLLKDSSYSEYIKWENVSDYTFRIVNPAQLSRLWGIQKNRTNMTYEKLSRALRYYYRMDIIEKVPGRRLTYRFMRPPHEIKRGQRGAKPGVPRKSRSTDEEVEELEAMEAMEGEISDEESRLPSIDYKHIPPQSYYSKPDSVLNGPTTHPLDLVNHQRYVGGAVYRSPSADLADSINSTQLFPQSEPLISQLSATRTSASLASVIKNESREWTNGHPTNSPEASPHQPGE